MKRFLVIFGLVLFVDIAYQLLYSLLLVNAFDNEFLSQFFSLIEILVSSPAIFIDRTYPFYAPLPFYQSILIFLANVFVQAFLVYSITKKRKINFDEDAA